MLEEFMSIKNESTQLSHSLENIKKFKQNDNFIHRTIHSFWKRI